MPSRSPAAEPVPLPPGYRFVRDRSRAGATERLIEAEGNGRRVALRLSPAAGGSEARSELAVLASVAHPGLARLLDFGPLPGGGQFVAREWIEGADLASWARGRGADEIGRVVAQLCAPLEALHARGFVHGDLKAANVLVVDDEDGARPVLTDFGLARAHGERSAGGTLFHLAPEVLLGGAVDARADLFALGVMLHELLVGRRPSAREFYGRFPAFDFFEATGTRAEDLPEWARDVVAALLERRPQQRPASAASIGRTLAGRLGLSDPCGEGRVEVHWPVTRGREQWLESLTASLAASPPPQLRWCLVPRGEEPQPLLDELAVRAALSGVPARRCDVTARDARELESFVRDTCASHTGAVVILAVSRGEAWTLHAVETLARELLASAGERPAGILVGAPATAPDSDLPWSVLEVPEVEAASVAAFVRETLEAPPELGETFAQRLAESAGGSATRVERALRRAVREGWIVAGDRKPRLRAGTLPASLADADVSIAPRSDDARVLAALHAAGGSAQLADLAAVSALAPAEFGRTLAQLVERGALALEHSPRTAVRSLVAAPERAEAWLGEEDWRELHAAWGRRLEASAAPRAVVLPHRLRAGEASAAEVVEECEALRERGQGELALQLAQRAIAVRREANRAPETELIAESAFAWVAVGQTERAGEAIAAWDDESALDARTRALAERVRGQIATARHELVRALEHFERARSLDPGDGGLSALAKVRVLAELGRDRDVLSTLAELRAAPRASQAILPRNWINLRILEAVSLFRTGDAAGARELLERDLAGARRTADAGAEAGLRINLATIERRAGELSKALAHFERAIELYEASGLLPGLAQARAQFGSTLREVGELARAQPLLEAALALRERLGDRVGATSVRGMLGLLLADRGHVRAAAQELRSAAKDLRSHGRTRAAVLLEERAVEVAARYGERTQTDSRLDSEAGRAAEGDPRMLLSRARAEWLGGDAAAARELVQRGEALAASLGLVALQDEARFLLARLAGESAQTPARVESLLDEDQLAFALLARAPLDAKAARELAERLAQRGRDDRAARLYLAVAARSENGASDAQRADELLALCTRGLTEQQAAELERALLSLPDPWPEDFVAHEHRRAHPEDDEMEVIGLLDINHRLLAQEDLRSLLGMIVEQALSVSGAQRGFLILEKDGELEVDTALDSRRGGIDTPEVEVSGSVLRDALRQMKPVRVSNAIDDPLLGAAPSVIDLELRSVLCVPFEVQKGVRGVIYVDHRLREGAFDARVERMLALLADQAALAILQVRRLEEIRRLNRELGRQVARKDSDLKTAAEALRKHNLPAPAAGLVGDAPPMREVRRLIERAAQSKLSVLVIGPSGTGKELAARALHELGPRREGPFVGENCAALPASLIEAELFGARRGAFTGADRDREGLFERASGGTLFLDEIGELPLELQAKLLRALETGQVRRLGDDRVRTVDVRLVAATNRDLAREVAENRFRADLYYRLDGLRVAMPALAAHPEDIPALVDHFFRMQADPGKEPRRVAPQVLARLCRRPWPGNVRELFNELARLAVMSEGDVLDPALVRDSEASLSTPSSASNGVRTLEELEREAILQALQVSGNDKRKAAELLGISRAKVYQRLKDWGLSGPGEGA